MKTGALKQLLSENNIKSIKVLFGEAPHIQTYIVIGARFDPTTRSLMFLDMTQNPHTRNNKTQSIRSYMLDFKDTHNILVVNKDKEDRVYELTMEYTIESNILLLSVLHPEKINTTGLLRSARQV
jgi:beta-galactosidase/beta-glucuronidase